MIVIDSGIIFVAFQSVVNPIENIFHLTKQALLKQAVDNNITFESVNQLETKVRKTLESVAALHTNNTIQSMAKRIRMIIKYNGDRSAY